METQNVQILIIEGNESVKKEDRINEATEVKQSRPEDFVVEENVREVEKKKRPRINLQKKG